MVGVESLEKDFVINIIRLWYLEYPYMPIRKTPMAGNHQPGASLFARIH